MGVVGRAEGAAHAEGGPDVRVDAATPSERPSRDDDAETSEEPGSQGAERPSRRTPAGAGDAVTPSVGHEGAGQAIEEEPAAAAELFGGRIDLARSYTHELATRGEELGLIGPLEVPRIWTRHVLNCALVAPLMRGTVADIGSGAGLPGLVLAIARPDVRFVLVEPMERRVDWLRSEVARLELDNVEVERARAEEVGRARFDQVTARAVSALTKLIPITAPLLRSGGELVFMKGARITEEIAAAEKVIRKARLLDVENLVLGEGITDDTTRVFRARLA